jgi:hypothetical protein
LCLYTVYNGKKQQKGKKELSKNR